MPSSQVRPGESNYSNLHNLITPSTYLPPLRKLIWYSGIGLETTVLFAREGAAVLMADISEPALAKALAKVKELVPYAPKSSTIKCDVSKEADVQAMVESQDE